MEYVVPLQIGLTAFSCDGKLGTYTGNTYNFYLKPASFPTIEKSFCFQVSTWAFLEYHQFDFNKVLIKFIFLYIASKLISFLGFPFRNTLYE